VRLRTAAVLVALVAGLAPAVAAAAPSTGCVRTPMPYAGLPGAALEPADHVSKDSRPVRYTRWRGTVPGYDGMPFSVDVTVPCGATSPLPTVVMAHGFSDDKTVWQETGRSDRVVSQDRPETNSRWNNIWFASRGYAVLNYTARGFRDSCGPDTPGATRTTPPPQCLPFEYWIHLDDKRWEVRDAQWLTGGLVQSRLSDPRRLVITGGSYGGGPALSGALLAGNVMCGGAAVPAALGVDACLGRANGALAPWTTPDGRTRLTWAASVPMYTFADLIQVLAPNGRGSDGSRLAPRDGDHSAPFGVPMAGTIAGLYAAGASSGFYSPPGRDPDSDITTNTARLLAGNPFSQADPVVARGVQVYRDFKSPLTTPPQGRVPTYLVQGFTDPLFPAMEALQVVNMMRAKDRSYPVKLFLGDLGHDYTAQRQDDWDLAHVQMNAFVDHYLRPDRTPVPPAFDVGATVTRCLDPEAPLRFAVAPTWEALHPRHVTFRSAAAGTTSSAVPGPGGRASDPITTATLPLPGAYKGCRIVRPAAVDPTVASYEFPLAKETVLMGGPVVDLTFSTSAPDTQLHVRVWDVAADGSAQGLVTRGTYRSVDAPGTGRRARFQLNQQGYRFPAGHRLKVEVTANDAPYFQVSNVPAVVQVTGLQVTLPLLGGRR
jgi:predicted acyl esterase